MAVGAASIDASGPPNKMDGLVNDDPSLPAEAARRFSSLILNAPLPARNPFLIEPSAANEEAKKKKEKIKISFLLSHSAPTSNRVCVPLQHHQMPTVGDVT